MTIDFFTAMAGESSDPDDISPLRYKGLGDRLGSDWWDQASAAYELGADYSTRMILEDMSQLSSHDRVGPQISQDVLNERYKESGVKFDRPMSEESAELIVNRKKRQQYLRGVLESGPINPTVAGIGGGLISNVVDPFEIGIGLTTGGLLKASGVSGAFARRFGSSFVAQKTMAGLDNAVGAGLIEPLAYEHARKMLEDRDYTDTLEQLGYAFAAPFAIGAVGYGIGSIGRGASAAFDGFRNKYFGGPGVSKAQYDHAVDQFAGDRAVDVDAVVMDSIAESNPTGQARVAADINFGPYAFSPIDVSSPVSGRFWSVGPPGRTFGYGRTVLVDNPMVANAEAASRYNTVNDARLSQFNVDGAVLVSASRVLDTNDMLALKSVISTVSSLSPRTISDETVGRLFSADKARAGLSLGEFIARVSDTFDVNEQIVVDAISASAKNVGQRIDGVMVHGTNSNIIVFSSGAISDGEVSISQVKEIEPVREALGGMSLDDAQRIRDRNISNKSLSFYDGVSEIEATRSEEIGKIPDQERTRAIESSELDDAVEQLKIDAESGDKGAEGVLEQFKEADKMISMNEKIIKAITSCMMKE